MLALGQRLADLILGRQQRRAVQFVQRPCDPHRRVVPGEAALELRGVVVGRLVQEVGRLAEHHEAVREAGRHPQLAVVVLAEFDPVPLPEGRRALAQVHRHVEDAALDDPYELALRVLDLVVQAAQHALGGAGVVVLHEVHLEAGGLAEDLGVEAFQEETAGVTEDFRFEDQEARDAGGRDLHQNTLSSRMRNRYWP